MRALATPFAGLMALVAGALAAAPRAVASELVYDLTSCFATGCPPASSYGTVTVSSVSATEVAVDLQLASGEVFVFGGAGKPLLFDISGNPTVSVTGLPSGYTFTNHPMTMADGTGKWDYFIDCPAACGSGTSGQVTGPLMFDVTLASGITPASFIANNKGLFFAADIGIPTAPGQFVTGDVAASTATPVPLPPSSILLGSALAAFGLVLRRGREPMPRGAPAA
jgi:hypothetical protein